MYSSWAVLVLVPRTGGEELRGVVMEWGDAVANILIVVVLGFMQISFALQGRLGVSGLAEADCFGISTSDVWRNGEVCGVDMFLSGTGPAYKFALPSGGGGRGDDRATWPV